VTERAGEREASGRPPAVARLVDFILVACMPVVALLPALAGGFPDGHDWLFELVRVAEYGHAFAEGQLFPAWGPNLYFGFGSPIFLFYAPLYSALSSALVACGIAIDVATVLALLVFGWIGAAASWKLGAELAGGESGALAGRVTAAFYVLSPYLLGNALERNANAEYAALLLAPLPLLGVALVGRRPRSGASILAVGLALVVTAHNLTALTVSAATLTLALALYGSREKLASLAATLTGFAFGIALSAAFWLPAIGYAGEVRQKLITTGKFDFHNNFESLGAYVDGREFFSPGPLAALLAIAIVAALLQMRRLDTAPVRPVAASVTLALASVALLTPLSMPAWEHLPFLRLYQFPWRFCGLLALATAIGIGPVLSHWLASRRGRFARPVELALILLFVASAVPRWLAYEPLSAEVRRNATRALTARSIQARGMPATVLDDYLPPGAERGRARAFRGNAPTVLAIEGSASVVSENSSGSKIALTVSAAAPSRLIVSRWASPVWRATVDGSAVAAERAPDGCLAVSVPAGTSRVVVEVAQPPLRRLGLAISAIALLAGAALLAALGRQRQ
jgi:hypothetical protein